MSGRSVCKLFEFFLQEADVQSQVVKLARIRQRYRNGSDLAFISQEDSCSN